MRRLVPWLAAAAIIVMIFGTIYTAVQQSQRSDAKMPQIQIAEDTAQRLDHGIKLADLDTQNIDISSSLDPFYIVYTKSGQPAAGTGYLGDAFPLPPFGVLQAANGKPYSSVTWQPNSSTRIAVVVVAANNYYVLSGRSLAVVEQNEMRTMLISSLGCLASLVILGAAFYVFEFVDSK